MESRVGYGNARKLRGGYRIIRYYIYRNNPSVDTNNNAKDFSTSNDALLKNSSSRF